MGKLQIDDEAKRLHWEYVKQEVLPKINEELDHGTDITEEYRCFLKHCKKHAYKIAVGEYTVIKKHIERIEKIVGNIKNFVEEWKDRILKIYDYEAFSKIKRNSNKEWSPYKYVEMMKVRLCPYCNRHYVTTINLPKRAYRADIDHFLPKSEYPFLAMSLGNWVPSCMPCNRSLKRNHVFTKEAANPYVEDFNELYEFSIEMDGVLNDTKVCILLKSSNFQEIKDIFALEEQYKYHIDIAKDFIDKARKYPEDKIKDMMKLVGVEYSEREKAHFIGYPETYEDIDKEVLGKFKRDMAKAVGYIDIGY